MRTNEETVTAFQNGDRNALEELWKANERGVKYVADKIAAAGLGDPEDLKQEGFFGLRRAAELYDPAEGTPFITFAWHWIRQAMYMSVRETGTAIRIPAHMQEKLRKYRRFISEYMESTGSRPSDAQICAVLHVSSETLDTIRAALQMVTLASLDGPVGDPEDGLTLADSVASEGDLEEDVARRLDHERMAQDLAAMIEKMDPAKRDALRTRFWEQKPQAERQNQKTQQALAELRRPEKRIRLEPYYLSYLSSRAYKGGLSYFKNTGSSITETLALQRIQHLEESRARLQKTRQEALDLLKAGENKREEDETVSH